MEKVEIKAYAKLNLTLNVLNKRSDGYHNLESIFQPISLYDELVIEKNDKNELILNCNNKLLETPSNIIIKAFNKMKEKYNEISGVNVYLTKNIPLESGMRWWKYRLCEFYYCFR